MNCCSISVKAALKHLSSFVFLETTAEMGGGGECDLFTLQFKGLAACT